LTEILSPAERLERLEALKHLLESRGLRVAPTRVGQYVKAFSRFSRGTGGRPIEHHEFDEYLFVLREVDELLWVFKGLQKAEPPGALDKLEKALGGRMLSREDANSTARNYLFELRIASYFLQAGFIVDMAAGSDLAVRFDDTTVYVECKRPESIGKLQARARDAYRQLHRRLGEGSTAEVFGLAAMDVGRILHPGQGLSLGVTAEHARVGLRAQLVKLDDEHQFRRTFRRDERILSVWLQMLVPVLHVAEAQPATRFSSLHLPLVPEFGKRRRVFDRLRVAFEIAPFG
jgi:hypothetical protein